LGAAMAELLLHNISKRFGGLLTVNNLDLEVQKSGALRALFKPHFEGNPL